MQDPLAVKSKFFASFAFLQLTVDHRSIGNTDGEIAPDHTARLAEIRLAFRREQTGDIFNGKFGIQLRYFR